MRVGITDSVSFVTKTKIHKINPEKIEKKIDQLTENLQKAKDYYRGIYENHGKTEEWLNHQYASLDAKYAFQLKKIQS